MNLMEKVLVTGGAGYIGSHTAIELITAGYTPVIIDNFSNSEPWILERIQEITGVMPKCYVGDCTDSVFMDTVFTAESDIKSVIHFAAFKSVGESVQNPLKYYKNNIDSTIVLLDTMKKHGVSKLVFSSSATVYGELGKTKISESEPCKKATSPYAATKVMCEDIIEIVALKSHIQAISLRYFNPIGAHASGRIGELPKGVPNNLVPYITQSAAGLRDPLTIFGTDYDTEDGTCVRDYIHVVDLAQAHIASLAYLDARNTKPYDFFNVGTGSGVSVLELVTAFESATGLKVPYSMGQRREGDIDAYYADVQKISNVMHWSSALSLESALLDSWRWQQSLL